MSNAPNTSRVLEALQAARDRLAEQTWPASPVSQEEPTVTLVETDLTAGHEWIVVVPQAGDDAVIEWRQLPRGRREQLPIEIRLLLASGEEDETAALARFATLKDVAERAFYDDVAAAADARAGVRPLDIPGATRMQGVQQVAARIFRSDEFTGICAEITLLYVVEFNI